LTWPMLIEPTGEIGTISLLNAPMQ
jgi:hypothetical protein